MSVATLETSAVSRALGHRDNGRRLMTTALQLISEGFAEGGAVLRDLSRREYAKACQVLLVEIDENNERTGS